jgi:hypothetical protein
MVAGRAKAALSAIKRSTPGAVKLSTVASDLKSVLSCRISFTYTR